MALASHLLVGNPTAQSGKNAERIEQARRLLDAAGIAHDFVPTRPAGGTVAVVAEALRDPARTTAIYMGGDGTFAEVAKGILASGRAEGVRLGMLPTGTANDQGRSFGLQSAPEDLERNVGVIAAGHETRLDVGRIRADGREDYFFDSAGWGISPRTLALRNEDRKAIEGMPLLVREIWRDQLVYAGALLRTFLASYVEDDKFDAELVLDGGDPIRLEGLSDLVVKGTRVYGGLWVLDPAARHDDGLFEVIPFMGKRDWASKALISLEPTGAATEALAMVGVTHSPGYRGASIRLTLSPHPGGPPLAAQIDGEEFPATPQVAIDVLPRLLRLLVPAEAGTRQREPVPDLK